MPVPEDEVNLLDYWRVIWKRRWLIGGLCVAAVLTAMVVSLQMPKIYESTASILPPLSSGGSGSGMAAAAAALGAGGLGSLPGMPATTVDIFVALLKSKTLAEQIVERFDLVSVYRSETDEDAIKALEGRTKISVSKEKVIRVTVEATDPKLAADVANGYTDGLDRLNRTLAISKVSQNRLFVEKRLAEVMANLTVAEEDLASFQARKKTISLGQQTSAALSAATAIQSRISAAEVQLEVIQNYYTPENPDVVKLQLELDKLRQQLYVLESGKGGKGMLPGDRLHPAFVTVPSLSLEFTRLMRKVKVQETLYSMLAAEYEQTKLAEARDTPTVQVLDPAKPPMHKSKPRIRLNMMIAGVLALFLSIFLAFFLEYLDRIRAQERK